MKRVLITGMSGVGKSTVIAELARRGFKAVDADQPAYSAPVDFAASDVPRFGAERDWCWREDVMTGLLDAEDAAVLFVSGTSSNQSKFYPRFDHVVLLTAPDAVMNARMIARDTNAYGKDPAERARQLALKPIVEPLLRRAADVVLDTSAPLEEVAARLLRLA